MHRIISTPEDLAIEPCRVFKASFEIGIPSAETFSVAVDRQAINKIACGMSGVRRRIVVSGLKIFE